LHKIFRSFCFSTGIGILANAFVIAVISIWEKCQKNRTVTNSFVVNLAIADLLFLMTLPLHMPIILDNDGWVYGAAMCKIIEAIKYINFRASILFLTMMSVDRYLGIVFSMRSREYRTRRNAINTCFALWLLSCVAAIPVLLFAKVDPFRKTCELQFPGYQSNFASASELETFYSNFALFFALPIICIIFCYCAIIRAVLTRHVRSNANKQAGQHNVARMVAVLVGVFILSWGPFQTWRLLTLPPGQQVPHADSCLVIETTVTVLAWSNSAINPILYSISSKRF
uniref:G-protein coupled receptors family 1 profile domain-containing protein n=1 Tax=Ciona savignyi TaxID=51511 RepID=H2Z4R7_CIOSA